MSLLTGLKLTDADAVLAAKQVSDQRKLIKDIPTMIECLIIMTSFKLTPTKTHDMLMRYRDGYNRYGQLHSNMLPVLQSVILQHSNAILQVVAEGQEAVADSITQPSDTNTKKEDAPF